MDRGVSTVLDVAICLLLIGVAVVTLLGASAPGQQHQIDADPDAATLATSTAPVSTDSGVVHTSLAHHLAIATLLEVTVEDSALFAGSYPDAVRETVSSNLDDDVIVEARWQPYPNSTMRGRIEVGTPPPSEATIAATRMSVPIGIGATPHTSYDSIAESLAGIFVDRVFPRKRTRLELVDGRTASATAERYRLAGETLAVDVEQPLSMADTDELDRRLSGALSDRFETELREEFSSSRSAREGTNTDVTIVVRRWQR